MAAVEGQPRSLSLVHRTVAAAGASVVSAFIVNPLDVVKIRIQAQGAAGMNSRMMEQSETLLEKWSFATCDCFRSPTPRQIPTPACGPACTNTAATVTPLYRGTIDGLRKIVASEGMRVLWRGTDVALMMAIPMVGIYLPLYDYLLLQLHEQRHTNAATPLIAGTLARTVAVYCTAPFELLRTRLQAHSPAAAAAAPAVADVSRCGTGRAALLLQHLPSSADAGGSRLRAAGRLWRGVGATLARDVPFSALYWGMVEPIRGALLSEAHAGSSATEWQVFSANVTAGAVAGGLAGAITTPFDVLKTRTQLSADKANPLLSSMRSIARQEGVAGLFRGWSARSAKAAPACAIVLSAYELLKHCLLTINFARNEERSHLCAAMPGSRRAGCTRRRSLLDDSTASLIGAADSPGDCKGAVADKCCTKEIKFDKDLAVTSPLFCGVVIKPDEAKALPELTHSLKAPGTANTAAAESEVLALELVEPAVPLTWTDGGDFVCVCKGQPSPDDIAQWSEKPSFELPHAPGAPAPLPTRTVRSQEPPGWVQYVGEAETYCSGARTAPAFSPPSQQLPAIHGMVTLNSNTETTATNGAADANSNVNLNPHAGKITIRLDAATVGEASAAAGGSASAVLPGYDFSEDAKIKTKVKTKTTGDGTASAEGAGVGTLGSLDGAGYIAAQSGDGGTAYVGAVAELAADSPTWPDEDSGKPDYTPKPHPGPVPKPTPPYPTPDPHPPPGPHPGPVPKPTPPYPTPDPHPPPGPHPGPVPKPTPPYPTPDPHPPPGPHPGPVPKPTPPYPTPDPHPPPGPYPHPPIEVHPYEPDEDSGKPDYTPKPPGKPFPGKPFPGKPFPGKPFPGKPFPKPFPKPPPPYPTPKPHPAPIPTPPPPYPTPKPHPDPYPHPPIEAHPYEHDAVEATCKERESCNATAREAGARCEQGNIQAVEPGCDSERRPQPICKEAAQSACSTWQLRQLQDHPPARGASTTPRAYVAARWMLPAWAHLTCRLSAKAADGWRWRSCARALIGAEETGRRDKIPPQQRLCSHCGGLRRSCDTDMKRRSGVQRSGPGLRSGVESCEEQEREESVRSCNQEEARSRAGVEQAAEERHNAALCTTLLRHEAPGWVQYVGEAETYCSGARACARELSGVVFPLPDVKGVAKTETDTFTKNKAVANAASTADVERFKVKSTSAGEANSQLFGEAKLKTEAEAKSLPSLFQTNGKTNTEVEIKTKNNAAAEGYATGEVTPVKIESDAYSKGTSGFLGSTKVESEAKASGSGPFQVDGSTKAETEVKTFGLGLSLSLSLSAPGTPARLCAAPICVLGWPTRCLFAAATGIADANAKVTPGSVSASSATHSSSQLGGVSKAGRGKMGELWEQEREESVRSCNQEEARSRAGVEQAAEERHNAALCTTLLRHEAPGWVQYVGEAETYCSGARACARELSGVVFPLPDVKGVAKTETDTFTKNKAVANAASTADVERFKVKSTSAGEANSQLFGEAKLKTEAEAKSLPSLFQTNGKTNTEVEIKTKNNAAAEGYATGEVTPVKIESDAYSKGTSGFLGSTKVESEAKASGSGPFQVDGSTKAETEVKTFGLGLSLSLSLSAPGTPARLCAAPICVLGWPTRCLFAAATGIADANAKVTPGSVSASSATHSSSQLGGVSKEAPGWVQYVGEAETYCSGARACARELSGVVFPLPDVKGVAKTETDTFTKNKAVANAASTADVERFKVKSTSAGEANSQLFGEAKLKTEAEAKSLPSLFQTNGKTNTEVEIKTKNNAAAEGYATGEVTPVKIESDAYSKGTSGFLGSTKVESEAKASGSGPFQVDGSTKAETEVKTFGLGLSLSLSLSAPGTPARLCAAPICVLGWPTRCLFAAATGIADANAKVTPGSVSASSATHSSSQLGGVSKEAPGWVQYVGEAEIYCSGARACARELSGVVFPLPDVKGVAKTETDTFTKNKAVANAASTADVERFKVKSTSAGEANSQLFGEAKLKTEAEAKSLPNFGQINGKTNTEVEIKTKNNTDAEGYATGEVTPFKIESDAYSKGTSGFLGSTNVESEAKASGKGPFQVDGSTKAETEVKTFGPATGIADANAKVTPGSVSASSATHSSSLPGGTSKAEAESAAKAP
ncbi:Mitochondrial carrier protein MTM1 [Chlorella vulgaris]